MRCNYPDTDMSVNATTPSASWPTWSAYAFTSGSIVG